MSSFVGKRVERACRVTAHMSVISGRSGYTDLTDAVSINSGGSDRMVDDRTEPKFDPNSKPGPREPQIEILELKVHARPCV